MEFDSHVLSFTLFLIFFQFFKECLKTFLSLSVIRLLRNCQMKNYERYFVRETKLRKTLVSHFSSHSLWGHLFPFLDYMYHYSLISRMTAIQIATSLYKHFLRWVGFLYTFPKGRVNRNGLLLYFHRALDPNPQVKICYSLPTLGCVIPMKASPRESFLMRLSAWPLVTR